MKTCIHGLNLGVTAKQADSLALFIAALHTSMLLESSISVCPYHVSGATLVLSLHIHFRKLLI